MAKLALQGKVTKQGIELKSEAVTIFHDNVVVCRTFTDRHGRFFVADLPTGSVVVSVGDKDFTVAVTSGQTAEVDALL
ncbi:hypothetical protein FTO74_10625 [Granulicella sp. WH15]|uniref:hypothetical protein n=1 Tax=Granulicella sp. WH15 TaxID=2602070 RepID=UPI001366CF17|nr:hypothetical protein [Granulicella sp. WH15]QHN03776.1 hypothetical protein FTO74_10625 [Granulicella sp. WH15]